jgi:hypothetical protein
MNTLLPSRFAAIGSVLIIFSGILNFALGLSVGAWYYEPYVNENMGHVGVVAGIIAVVLGMLIYYLVIPLYRMKSTSYLIASGLMTVVLGHLGAVAGALFVGTAGLVCLYTAGIWMVIIGIRSSSQVRAISDSNAESATN